MNPNYRNVRFHATEPPSGWPAAFGMVTAWNPMDEDTSSEGNQAAHARLEAMVRNAALASFPVTGGNADMTHQEPGLGIVFAAEAEAVAMGRAFRQRAVFWLQDGTLWLVSCVDGHCESLGAWEGRLV